MKNLRRKLGARLVAVPHVGRRMSEGRVRDRDLLHASLLREAAKRAPDQAEIRLHAAIALADAGVDAEAREHLEAALKLDPFLERRDDVRKLVERLRK